MAASPVAKNELSNVRQQIKQQQQSIQQHNQSLKQLNKEIQQTDQQIDATGRKLHQLEQQQTAQEQQIDTLKKKTLALEKESQHQKQQLAKQLDGMYRLGNGEYLQLMLNQQRPDSIERMLGYYSYFNKARVTQLQKLDKTMQELADSRQQLVIANQNLEQLQQQTRSDQQQLEQQKENRERVASRLRKELKGETSSLGQLRQAAGYLEKQLKQEQQRQLQLKKKAPMDGLRRYKKRLQWPIRGRLLHLFNTSNSNQVPWKGIVIATKEGAPVKAIYSGEVLFAGWLQGFGMVLVIDHGKDYMSLYGYNQSLLKKTGDTVKTGETIALAGRSGGQSRSSLYFEIRYKGRAVNPLSWLK
ncbi:murein hydrolase activator EnvC family protein [Dongshaea marina]|uniref:murein hydrolase activator EnvC family protein n=1 Tax=Dongshaea marina TaxID=2047966 RepID=UPI00131F40B2|nr:peptidoglycan DD-metalloendopeptidase family protein [Dongshaea marina]